MTFVYILANLFIHVTLNGMTWRAMKQIFNWKDCDNLNFQYLYCLLKMANDITCPECLMSLTKQITIAH